MQAAATGSVAVLVLPPLGLPLFDMSHDSSRMSKRGTQNKTPEDETQLSTVVRRTRLGTSNGGQSPNRANVHMREHYTAFFSPGAFASGCPLFSAACSICAFISPPTRKANPV